jgi:hypothetical protein
MKRGFSFVRGRAIPKPHLREDSEGVGVTQTSLPTLNGDNGLVGLDNVQSQSGLETESETASKKFSAAN